MRRGLRLSIRVSVRCIGACDDVPPRRFAAPAGRARLEVETTGCCCETCVLDVGRPLILDRVRRYIPCSAAVNESQLAIARFESLTARGHRRARPGTADAVRERCIRARGGATPPRAGPPDMLRGRFHLARSLNYRR